MFKERRNCNNETKERIWKGLGENVEISTSKQRRKVEYNKQVNEQGLEGKLRYGGGVKRHPTDLFKHRLITQHILPDQGSKLVSQQSNPLPKSGLHVQSSCITRGIEASGGS